MSTIIGLVSTFRLPLQKSGRLDVGVGRRHDEVQKGSRRVADWTLEWGEGMMRSKREVEAWRIGR